MGGFTIFSLKKIFLANKIPLTVLGMVIPFVLISVVYQLRRRLGPVGYKLCIIGSVSTIAFVPIFIVFLHNTNALSVGDCIEDRRRTVEIELEPGKKVSMPLLYKVKSTTNEKYELQGNDKSAFKLIYNRVDLEPGYRKRKTCPRI